MNGIGCWLLVIGCWGFVAGSALLVARWGSKILDSGNQQSTTSNAVPEAQR